MTKYKAPPAFKEGDDYANWRLDIELWQSFTSLDKNKHGTALLLELREGKVKDAVRALGKDVIAGSDDGLAKIIEQLDKIYQEDVAQATYRVYCKFERYVRQEEMCLKSYIAEFEKMLADLKKQKIVLPEAVLAYRVLNSANLPPEKIDLALATVKALTYKDMSETLGKIFSVQANVSALEAINTPEVKVEPVEECNYTSQMNNGFGRENSSRERWVRGPMRYQKVFNRGNFHPYNNRGGRNRTQNTGCFVCNDSGHFARDCPKRAGGMQYSTQGGASGVQMETEDITPESTYITLMSASQTEDTAECFINHQNQSDLGGLVFETLACAVIDSGCTKTVVGKSWLDNYVDALDENQKKLMLTEDCCTPFRFGDGKETISRVRVKIPGRIGRHNILIEANVVKCDLPLLLSKPSLKKAGAVINFRNDKMTFNGEEVQLFETESGHYCVPICNKKKLVCEDPKEPNIVLTLTEEALFGEDYEEMKKKATKLHRQFSHAPGYRLKVLLKNAGFERDAMFKAIDEVCENCEICIRYKKPKPRPVVGLPRGQIHIFFSIENKLSAMDSVSVSKVVDNASAMHKANEEFVACESSQEAVQRQSNDSSAPRTHSTARKALPMVKFLPKFPEDGDKGVLEKAYIHSSTGKYSNSLNIQLDGESEIECVDWREVATEWEEVVLRDREGDVMLSSIVSYDD